MYTIFFLPDSGEYFLWQFRREGNSKSGKRKRICNSMMSATQLTLPESRVPISLCKNPRAMAQTAPSRLECISQKMIKQNTQYKIEPAGCLYITDFHFVNKHLPNIGFWQWVYRTPWLLVRKWSGLHRKIGQKITGKIVENRRETAYLRIYFGGRKYFILISELKNGNFMISFPWYVILFILLSKDIFS